MRYRVPLCTGKWARYINREIKLSLFYYLKAMECLPNRLTPFNSEIYYKEENYLKVKTVVFKYITPLIVKRFSTLVYQYIALPRFYIPIFPHSKFYYVTQLPFVLWFYQSHQFCLLRTNFNPIQVPFQYLYYPAYKVRNKFTVV